jgi:hypothetical protein
MMEVVLHRYDTSTARRAHRIGEAWAERLPGDEPPKAVLNQSFL